MVPEILAFAVLAPYWVVSSRALGGYDHNRIQGITTLLGVLGFWGLGSMGNNEGPKSQGSGRVNGFIPSSFRAISSYLRIVSSGASTVARSAASVASSIVDRDDNSARDQVWSVLNCLLLRSIACKT